MVIRKVAVRAWLGDPGTEIEEARRRADSGDPDWQLWIEELERGEATLIDMRVGVTFELPDGEVRTVATDNHHIWMQLALHPAEAAAIVAEISAKDFEVLARQIQEFGSSFPVSRLEQMYVSVELDDGLIAALHAPEEEQGAMERDRARPGISTENA